MKKRIVLIDPWGILNTGDYLNGLIWGLASISELTVFVNYYFNLNSNSSVDVHKVFFKRSEPMRKSVLRTIIRGYEYVLGYYKIINFLKNNEKFDVIHINWLLMYRFDALIVGIMKAYTKKIVYTAHNVLPHINGEKYIRPLKRIYGKCDTIIVHGECIKQELANIFPSFKDKVYVQKHGCNLEAKTRYDVDDVSNDVQVLIEKYSKRFIFFGNIFYNKGIDRVVELWNRTWKDSLLIMVGRRSGEYVELDNLEEKINKTENILRIEGFVEDNLLNYLIDNSHLILLPYRHASMSGVIFTAVDFEKTILCTNVGAFSEYLTNGEDSIIVDNNDEEVAKMIDHIRNEISVEQLNAMGKKLSDNIKEKCSWNIIAKKMLEECY